MSSQFLQENAVGNMVKGRQHPQPFPHPLSRSKFSVLLRLQRHHKEHIFYIAYHHLGQEAMSTARGLFWEQLLGCIPDTSFGRGTRSSGPVLRSPFGDDEGVHCRRNQRVQNCHHQIQGWGGDGGGLQVGKHGSAEKQGDHGQVRGDPQHSPEDLHIGQHDENKTSQNKKSTNHNKANFPERIGHGFGDSGGDGAQVKNREVEEEEVHGGVEAVVTGYSGDDEAVAQEGSQVDAQEEPEAQELQLLPCVHERQEEELGDGAAVGHLLSLCKGPGQGGKGSDK
ncbi:hypothetical protein QYF61_016452 [Mycteria americana]|uniref:Uncharacterized protein n=1 Tax=Mycteria americana TaxID=33587 RepID=A0AAN7MHB4_MYCAM|nr:hypothetical protein QYF61_016452 [Mycteria americana]